MTNDTGYLLVIILFLLLIIIVLLYYIVKFRDEQEISENPHGEERESIYESFNKK